MYYAINSAFIFRNYQEIAAASMENYLPIDTSLIPIEKMSTTIITLLYLRKSFLKQYLDLGKTN